MNLLSIFQNLSPNARMGFAAGSTAVIIGTLALVFQRHLVFLVLLLVLAVLAVISFLLVRMLLRALAKRKAKPMERGIAGNLSAAPSQINAAQKLADLDSLRRSFQAGVDKFKAAGKDLYSLPWYVLVGQPGSGKTEAIRHSAIGFPPGLQDQLQGAGGTINMNWWFTNHAIILDTAGRLMFEEVAPGGTSEWQEFLKLLRTSRPNCPINGMLLVIPAESLLKDTADVIAKNAGKIAQQLDMIQRTLGVRFPVFVLITKSDYLTGFNQFFDDLTDPQLQHQIMGWSNPAPLDEPFKMEAVDAHLQEVRRRLIERRQRLLLDPVNTEDAGARRLDQVDALFALPDAVTKIAPRLRQYLETIFVAGEWSPKPLFLRGIYFTSSMSDGKTLDADLAQALGISVDALPASGVWRRDRAYFLKDLFLQKIFREKGLVTRASNAMKLQRQRKIALIAAGFAVVAILLALTWYGFNTFKTDVDNQRQYWHNAAVIYRSSDGDYLNIIRRDRHALSTPRFNYAGITEKIDGQTLADFFARGLELVRRPIHIPVIFRPVAILGGEVNADRLKAYRAMFNDHVVAPLVAATEARLLSPPPSTPPRPGEATAQTLALIELINLARSHRQGITGSKAVSESEHLNSLARFVLSPADYKAYRTFQSASIAETLKHLYRSTRQWPPKNLHLASDQNFYRALRVGVVHTIDVWNRRVASGNASLAAILKVQKHLAAFNHTEQSLIQWAQAYSFSDSASAGRLAWNNVSHLLGKLSGMSEKLTAQLSNLSRSQSLLAAYETSASHLITRRRHALELLARNTRWIDTIESHKKSPAAAVSAALGGKLPPQSIADLIALRKYILAAEASAQSPLAAVAAKIHTIDQLDLALVQGHRELTLRGRIYLAAAKLLTAPAVPSNVLAVSRWLSEFNAQADNIRSAASATAADLSKAGPTPAAAFNRSAIKASLTALDVVRAHRLSDVIGIATQTPVSDASDLEHLISSAAAKLPLNQNYPDIPLIPAAGKPFNTAFDPRIGGSLLSAWSTIGNDLMAPAGSSSAGSSVFGAAELMSRYRQSDPAYRAYRDAYGHYWAGVVTDQLQVPNVKWQQFYTAVSTLQIGELFTNLAALGRRAEAALAIPAVSGSQGYWARAMASIKVGRAQLNKTVNEKSWRKILNRWMQLSSDPLQARAQLLTEKPMDIYRRYIIRAADHPSFVQAYLASLTLAGVRSLADDALSRVDAILNRLRRKPAFPLFIPAHGGRPTIQFSSATIAGFAADMDSLPISTHAAADLTPDSTLNHLLRMMQGHVSYSVFGLTTGQMVIVRKILAALHGVSGKPLMCRLQVSAKDKTNPTDNTAQIIWPYMTITDSGNVLGVVSFRSPAANSLGSIPVPGGEHQTLKLKFYESDPNSTPAPKPNHIMTFSGPWAPLQLLYLYHARTTDGRHWRIVIETHDQFKAARKMVLSLTFSRPLPRISVWPRAHAP